MNIVKELWGFIGIHADGEEELLSIPVSDDGSDTIQAVFSRENYAKMVGMMVHHSQFSPQVKKVKLVKFSNTSIEQFWDFTNIIDKRQI
jgi:hypothetical protein